MHLTLKRSKARLAAGAIVVAAALLAGSPSARADLPAGAPSPRPAGQPVAPPPVVPQSPRPQQPATPPQQQPVPPDVFEPPPRVPAPAQRPPVEVPSPAQAAPPPPTAAARTLAPTTAPTTQQSSSADSSSVTRPAAATAGSAHDAATAVPTTAPATAATGAAATRPAGTGVEAVKIRRPGGTAGSKSIDGPPAATSDLPRVALALGSVIGLILALRWGARKLMATPAAAGNAHLMQVVARTALAPRQQMLLVRVGRRLIVVGESGGHLTSLGHIEDPDEVAAVLGQAKTATLATPTPAAAAFGSLFGKLSKRFGGVADARREDADHAWDDMADEPLADRQSERGRLLGDPDADETSSVARRDQVGLSEAEAQAAVEAARHDIKALRAKLQQVTQRLADPDEPGQAGNAATA